MTMHECRDRARMLGSYLDGELDAAKLIEIDEHVAQCETCREEAQLLHAMRGSLKRVVRGAAPSGLRGRIESAMLAERAREDFRDATMDDAFVGPEPRGGFGSWRSVVPLATAAALALFWGASTRGTSQLAHSHSEAGLGDELLAELVAEHAQPLPLEATDQDGVRGLERYVGVPVRPASFERAGARLVGGRVVPLHSQRAAIVQYEVGPSRQRVSVIVYDAEKIQVGASNLAPREVGTAEVRVGQEKGYSVVVAQRAGVGYVLASDLDPQKSAELAAAVYEDPPR